MCTYVYWRGFEIRFDQKTYLSVNDMITIEIVLKYITYTKKSMVLMIYFSIFFYRTPVWVNTGVFSSNNNNIITNTCV